MRSGYGLGLLTCLLFLNCMTVGVSAIDTAPATSRNKSVLTEEIDNPRSGGQVSAAALGAQAIEMSLTLADMALWQGVSDALIVGDRAYCWLYYGLQVVDISNPMAPIVLYEFRHPATSVRMAVVENSLFAAIPSEGLLVIDVTATPVLLHTFPPVGTSSVYGMDIEGNYLFLTNSSVISSHSGIQIYDISNPMAPVLASFENVLMLPINVDVQGNYAYVVDEWNLNVVDVANKAEPQWLSSVACDSDAWDIKANGSYAYVSNRIDTALVVVNIANPSAPFVAVKLNLDESDFWPTSLDLYGSFLFVQDGADFKILDISAPASPVIAADWTASRNARSLQIGSGIAFVPDWAAGLVAYDMGNPLTPSEIWRYEIPGMGYDVALIGNYAIEANGIKGIQIIDVSDAENLQVIGSYDTPGVAMGIEVRENYAYVADSAFGLMIFDVSNPTAPLLLGSCETPGQARRVAVYDQYAYALSGDSGITVVDINDPANPTVVNQVLESGILFHYLADNRLYVSSFQGSVSIYDLSIPQSPSLITNFAPGAYWTAGLAVRGDYLFLSEDSPAASRYGWLRVYNISDPQNPIPVAEVDTVDFTREMLIIDDYLYLADYTLGVRIFNIANPEAPYRAGHFDTNPGWPWAIAVRDQVVYVAADNGFLTLHLGDCAGPDGNGQYNISDVVFLITYIFGGGIAPNPLRAGDVNCDGQVNVSDAVYLISYIFGGGPAPCGGC